MPSLCKTYQSLLEETLDGYQGRRLREEYLEAAEQGAKVWEKEVCPAGSRVHRWESRQEANEGMG